MHDALFFPPQGFLFFHHAEQFWQVQTEIAGILQVILIRHLPEMEEAVRTGQNNAKFHLSRLAFPMPYCYTQNSTTTGKMSLMQAQL